MTDAPPRTGDPGDAQTLRVSFDQLPVAIGTTRGREHVFVGANRAYRHFSGGRDVLGLPARTVFAEAVDQGVFDSLDQVFDSGEAQAAQEWRIQLDRGHGPEDIYIDFTISPVLDSSDGSSIGLNIVLVDITEQVRARRSAQQESAEARRRYESAREVVAQVQAALLPTALPVLPGGQVAASYLLADADTAAGGDWFDAFALVDGRLALVVGDVVGHGVAASAAMGQLRVVLRERLLATGDVVASLDALDRLARHVPGGRAATVCVVVLDLQSGELAYCPAGHPPPLVLHEHAEARYLAGTGTGTLGSGTGFAVSHDHLGPRDVLLLYTDGILERPGRDVATGSVELARFADGVAGDRVWRGESPLAVDRLTTQTLELMTRQTGYADDITLLAAARRPVVPPLQVTLPSDASALGSARKVVDDWLDQLAVSTHDHVALAHAVVELVTNALEHSHLPPDDRKDAVIEVTAVLDPDGSVRLTVGDDGRWRERRPDEGSGRGYGLAMTRSLVDDLVLDRTDGGTRAQVRRVVSRPARLHTAATAPGVHHGPSSRGEPQLRVVDHSSATGARIAVHGALDATSVEDLGSELDHLTRGGVRGLVVDLSGVTHLASAAVAELHRQAPTGDVDGLRLYAPAGSTAHRVLSLVNLPHTTADPLDAGP